MWIIIKFLSETNNSEMNRSSFRFPGTYVQEFLYDTFSGMKWLAYRLYLSFILVAIAKLLVQIHVPI